MKKKQHLAKENKISEIREKVSGASGLVLTEYRGLNVEAMTRLRAQFREAGVEYKVYKNTLFKRAVDDTPLEGLKEHLNGPVAAAFGYEDSVMPAKVIKKFMADDEKDLLKIKAGYVDGHFFDGKGLLAIAELPGREELLSQVTGCMQGPIRNLVSVMAGVPRSLVNVINAYKEKKEKETA